MIKLIDLLKACNVPINLFDYKIHLATGAKPSPLEAYYEGKFKEWQEWQTRRNFECEHVVGLIELSKDKWLFGGVYKILGRKVEDKYIKYKSQLLKGQGKLIGRVIIFHKRRGRASYIWGKEDGGDFIISSILEQPLTIKEFPGFNNVSISFKNLCTIISQEIKSWKGALASIKGIYLITDQKTGKMYVGSALSNHGLWQRWSEYAITGHGGNKEIRILLKEKGDDYKDNFQFTLLEIADMRTPEDKILERESYWKSVLKTREFGYNSN